MSQFTSEQLQNIESWSVKRDALLGEIAVLEDLKNTLNKEISDGSESLTKIHTDISFYQGSLTRIKEEEENRKLLVSKELVALESQKSLLEIDIQAKMQKNIELDKGADQKLKAIELLGNFEKQVDKLIQSVKSGVDTILTKTQKHDLAMQASLRDVQMVSTEVIKTGNENIAETKLILEKLPQYVFELKKPRPLVRAYINNKGKVVNPVNNE